MTKHRRSIRLQGYDYSRAGAYFVTVCTQNRECMFGHIVGATPRGCPDAPCGRPEMALNDAGRMIQAVWDEIPINYSGIETDEFTIMPNHIHGIIVIVGATPCGRPDIGQAQGPAPTTMLSLADVMHRFKTLTTKRYTDGVKQFGWPAFPGRLWQRNYYEHIIRNDDELNRIREYIANNPMQWELDRENPDGQYSGQLRENGQPRGVAPTGMDRP